MFTLEIKIQLLDRVDPRDGTCFVDFVFPTVQPAIDVDEWMQILVNVDINCKKLFDTNKFCIISLQFKPQ